MMLAIKYARESKVPFLGICLGFQLAVVEWARHVLNIPGGSFLLTYYPVRTSKLVCTHRRHLRGV